MTANKVLLQGSIPFNRLAVTQVEDTIAELTIIVWGKVKLKILFENCCAKKNKVLN